MNGYGYKPCPFCGKESIRINHDLKGNINGIYCAGCRLLAKFTELPTFPKGHDTWEVVYDKWKATWNKRGGEP